MPLGGASVDTLTTIFGLATLIALAGAMLYNADGIKRLIQAFTQIVAGGLGATSGGVGR